MDEITRQKRVIDMMVTAHSVLRDRYNRRASFFEILLLVASVILNALIFNDAKFIQKFTSLTEDQQKLITGISCLVVFMISVVMLQVAWREKATSHATAADQLSTLKQECREIIAMPDSESKKTMILDFSKKYSQVNGMLIKIPDAEFNSLKLIHSRKVELSKLIDSHPGSRLWILKAKAFIASFERKQS